MVMCVAASIAKMQTNIIDRPRSSVSFGTPPMAATRGGYGGPAAWSNVSELLRTRGWVMRSGYRLSALPPAVAVLPQLLECSWRRLGLRFGFCDVEIGRGNY